MKDIIATSALVLATVFSADALAESRKPLEITKAHETEIAVQKFGERYVVERIRTRGRNYAKFVSEPAAIDPSAVIVFEVHSVSQDGVIPRWRCIAIENATECLGDAIKIPYVVGDVKMVLSVTAHHRQTTEGIALVTEAEHQRDRPAIARVWLER